MADFPGAVFDGEGASLIPGRPNLDQATIDQTRHRALVGNPEMVSDPNAPVKCASALPLGRVWLLKAGAICDQVPPAERQAARAMMREGMAILVLAPDAATETSIRIMLLDMLNADETPAGWCGHA